MKKKKRQHRTKVEKKELDFSVPMMSLGSEDDPCFGQLHSLEAPECNECGDNQACQIMMSQRLHGKRKAIESKQAFLDKEEEDVIKLSILEVFIYDFLKPDKVFSVSKLMVSVNERFNPDNRLKQENVLKYVRMAVNKSSRLKSFQTNGKRYITTKKK